MAVTIYYPARIRVALIEHLMIVILETIKAKKDKYEAFIEHLCYAFDYSWFEN